MAARPCCPPIGTTGQRQIGMSQMAGVLVGRAKPVEAKSGRGGLPFTRVLGRR